MKTGMKFRDENLVMQMRTQQFDSYQRLVNHELLVVYGNDKKRDAPVIYHRRDDAQFVTGLAAGHGPPGTGPPGTGPPGTGPPDTG